ncbi:MAG: hypothetical protein ACRC0Y_11110 [Fusobacteriaceae bacterium]
MAILFTKSLVLLKKSIGSKTVKSKLSKEQLKNIKSWNAKINKMSNYKNTINNMLISDNPLVDILGNKLSFDLNSKGYITQTTKNLIRESGLNFDAIQQRANIFQRRTKKLNEMAKSVNSRNLIEILTQEKAQNIKEATKNIKDFFDDGDEERSKILRCIENSLKSLEIEIYERYRFYENTGRELYPKLFNLNRFLLQLPKIVKPTWLMCDLIDDLIKNVYLDIEHNTSPEIVVEYDDEFILTNFGSVQKAIDEIENSVDIILTIE